MHSLLLILPRVAFRIDTVEVWGSSPHGPRSSRASFLGSGIAPVYGGRLGRRGVLTGPTQKRRMRDVMAIGGNSQAHGLPTELVRLEKETQEAAQTAEAPTP